MLTGVYLMKARVTSAPNHVGHNIGFSHMNVTKIELGINEMVAVPSAALGTAGV
jgi:hypothetical protein